MVHQIIRDLSDEVRSTFFATICDEYTDVSNKEQLAICLRWVDDYFESPEDFFGFYELKDIKSDTIVAATRDVLLRTQISLDQSRGQCYDGASNILGKKFGVAKQISDIQPKRKPQSNRNCWQMRRVSLVRSPFSSNTRLRENNSWSPSNYRTRKVRIQMGKPQIISANSPQPD